MANDNYLDITCYFSDNWKLQNRILDTVEVPELHASENITNNLETVMRNFKIEHKKCAIVSNNAAIMMKAVNGIGQNNLIRYTARSIQLSVNVGLQNDLVKPLTNKFRVIVDHFNRSSSTHHESDKEREKCMKNKSELIRDCITRWNSTCSTVKNIVRRRVSIDNVISNNKKIDSRFITSNEFKDTNDLVNVLESFQSVTLGSEKHATTPIANRLVKCLLNCMQENENDSDFIKTIKFTISNDLKKNKDQLSIILSNASAHDLRYHKLINYHK